MPHLVELGRVSEAIVSWASRVSRSLDGRCDVGRWGRPYDVPAMAVLQTRDARAARAAPAHRPAHDQEIRFCRAADGTRLAYAIHGNGPPLVVVSCWLSHLQYDWQSPVWRHFLDDLGRIGTVIRYDERGFGMSDWDVSDFSLPARLGDLETILAATGFERFALLGMSGGSSVAMAYAIAHSEQVSRLILYGTVCGEPPVYDDERWAREQVYRSMIQVGWAKDDPEFRRVFTRRFIPDATEEQMCWFDDLQRMSTSPENMLASRISRQQEDIVAGLPTISAPTIVLQARGDQSTVFENAVTVSSLIPGARLVPLESRNHILLADEPAWGVFIDEVTVFMDPDRRAFEERTRAGRPMSERLSERELDVLRLAAEGQTNEEIAAALTLSPRTVERHLSNVYGKLGLTGRAARAAAVAEFMRGRLS
jgi:pimeloyl-ACP methyl ester carboxylesterase/DNA-binding CsgD family transcriptional regulator